MPHGIKYMHIFFINQYVITDYIKHFEYALCMIKRITIFLFIILLCLTCNKSKNILVIGIVPSKSPAKLEKDFKLIKKYLENETGYAIKVYIPADYRELIKAMKEKKIDIGLFGPFSYIIAEKQQKLRLLLVRKNKQFGVLYNSLIITKRNSVIKNIPGLMNKKFAFVNTASTSGYMIPQALFVSRNIDIDTFLSGYYFSGSHDIVIKDVLSGKADAGAVSNETFYLLINQGLIKAEDFSIIWKSGDIPGSPYVARADLDEGRLKLFYHAMLDIHLKSPEALRNFDSNIESYSPARDELYNSVRNIVNILGYDYIEKNFL